MKPILCPVARCGKQILPPVMGLHLLWSHGWSDRRSHDWLQKNTASVVADRSGKTCRDPSDGSQTRI